MHEKIAEARKIDVLLNVISFLWQQKLFFESSFNRADLFGWTNTISPKIYYY